MGGAFAGWDKLSGARWRRRGIQLRLQRLSRYSQPLPLKPTVDTTLQDTPRKARGAFYYFDEEYERPRRRNRRQIVTPLQRGKYFYPDSLRVQSAGQIRLPGALAGDSGGASASSPHEIGPAYSYGGRDFFEAVFCVGGLAAVCRPTEAPTYGWGFGGEWDGGSLTCKSIGKCTTFLPRAMGRAYGSSSWAGESGVKLILEAAGKVGTDQGAGLLLHGRRHVLILRDQTPANGEALWIGGRVGTHYQHYRYREGFLWWGRSLKVELNCTDAAPKNGFGVIQAAGSWHQPLPSLAGGRPICAGCPGKPHKPPLLSPGRHSRLGQAPEVLNRSPAPPLRASGEALLPQYSLRHPCRATRTMRDVAETCSWET